MTGVNPDRYHADAWSLPRVVDFFDRERTTTADVYPSEWFFLKDRLREGMSILDIGCAQGGFAAVLAENLRDFRYTGVDVSERMVARARERHPGHEFLHAPGGDYSALGQRTFDLVLVLGILHLHEGWRDTLRAGWRHTATTLLTDTREIAGPTIEDVAVSHHRMDFADDGAPYTGTRLPYILLNAGEALAAVEAACVGARALSRYGYRHPPTRAAVTPVAAVMTTVYCVER